MDKECEQMMKRFAELNPPKNGTADIKTAIEKAYADMSRHAGGHRPEVKPESLKLFNKIFEEMPSVKNKKNFDEWHEDSCEKLRIAKLPNGFIMRCGRAQKVINMTFKYLCSWNYNQNDFKEWFQYCHMPLDDFTLEWFRRSVTDVIKIGDNPVIKIDDKYKWSKIDNYKEYYQIQEHIRNHQKDKSPLEQEFIEWPKISMERAAKAFFLELEKIKGLPLAEENSELVKRLIENGYEETVVNVLRENGYIITNPGKTEEA